MFIFSSLKKENIIEEYGINSVKLFEFFFALENKFGVTFSDDEIVSDNLDSLEKIILLVESKLSDN